MTSLSHTNEVLYHFLLPIIEEIPSIRETPLFSENPCDLILDELNAMNEEEYSHLTVLINGDQEEITKLIVDYRENLNKMFREYPLLTYGIIRRRMKEESWILLPLICSNCRNLFPHSHLLSSVSNDDMALLLRLSNISKEEELRTVLIEIRKSMKSGDSYNLYMFSLVIFSSILNGTNETLKLYHFYREVLIEQFSLPLTDSLYLVYCKIGKSLTLENVSLFSYYINNIVLNQPVNETLARHYLTSDLFHTLLKSILDGIINQQNMIISCSGAVSIPEEVLTIIMYNVFSIKNENLYKKLGESLSLYFSDVPTCYNHNYISDRVLKDSSFQMDLYIKFLSIMYSYIPLDLTKFVQLIAHQCKREKAHLLIVDLFKIASKDQQEEIISISRFYGYRVHTTANTYAMLSST